VGKKFAERIVVECREQAALLAAGDAPRAVSAAANGVAAEAVSALVNLGYKRTEPSARSSARRPPRHRSRR